MLRDFVAGATLCFSLSVVLVSPVAAENPFDEQIDQIRSLNNFGTLQRGIVRDWMEFEVEELLAGRATLAAFRTNFTRQRTNPQSSPEFVAEFAGRSAQAAVEAFGDATVAVPAAVALARVLYDFDHAATIDGMVQGLKSRVPGVRFLCAKGLSRRHADLSASATQFRQVAEALEEAAVKEKNATTLGWIYRALAIPGRAGDAVVFDRFINMFDARFQEQVYIERTLEAIEAILETVTGTGGGVREAIGSGGRDDAKVRDAVAAAARAWVGNEEVEGALNSTQWKVPRGAP